MKDKRVLFLVLVQVVLWAGMLSLPLFMVPRQTEMNALDALRHSTPPDAADMARHIFIGSLAFNICLIIFFYLHHYILFDKLIVPRKFTTYLFTVLGGFVLCFAANAIFKECISPQGPMPYHPFAFREFVKTGTWFTLILLISMALKLLEQWRQAEARAKEIETEQLRTELSFLHAQVNPHFLFNSLNTIYSLSLKKADAAPEAVLKLSELLRYVIDESKNEKVPLEQEINYIHNYIELQKLRSTSSLVVNYYQQGDVSSASIAPLLLLPFIENAFKYGISNSEPSPIDITVRTTANQLGFTVVNKKLNMGIKPSTGIGIHNVQRRLNLLYPGKHELEIKDTPEEYIVKLKINFV